VEVEVALDDGTLARRGAFGCVHGEHEAVELARRGRPPVRRQGRRAGGGGVLDEIGPELVGVEAVDSGW